MRMLTIIRLARSRPCPAFSPSLSLLLAAVRRRAGAGRGLRAIDPAATAWMLVASALVLLMTPALAFFYGGLVRSKNTLNTMMMSVGAMGAWPSCGRCVGYSLAFASGSGLVGGLAYAGLRGVGLEAEGAIPHLLFMVYQATFVVITAALISGAVAERMRFGPYLAFVTLWSVLVYAPVAHWVWDPDGWIFKLGALDFAGGTVVHVNAAAAALVAALVVGPRRDWGRRAILPHNVPFVLLGAGLLWFGWFGFNAGSALAANATAALAFANTFLAPAAALVVWTALDAARTGKTTAVGAATGIVVGLVAITPAAGHVGPLAALAIGAIAAVPSYCRHPVAQPHAARRRARRRRRARPRRHRRGAADGRLRRARVGRDGRRPARRQPGAGRHPGPRARRRGGLQRRRLVRAPQGARARHRPAPERARRGSSA